MKSREYRYIEKLISVSNNRGFCQGGLDILNIIAPSFLSKEEIKQLSTNVSNEIKYAGKTSFLESIKFQKPCSKCEQNVEIGSPGWISGKSVFHVICGLESLGEQATSNRFFNKWQSTQKTEKFNEEEIQ